MHPSSPAGFMYFVLLFCSLPSQLLSFCSLCFIRFTPPPSQFPILGLFHYSLNCFLYLILFCAFLLHRCASYPVLSRSEDLFSAVLCVFIFTHTLISPLFLSFSSISSHLVFYSILPYLLRRIFLLYLLLHLLWTILSCFVSFTFPLLLVCFLSFLWFSLIYFIPVHSLLPLLCLLFISLHLLVLLSLLLLFLPLLLFVSFLYCYFFLQDSSLSLLSFLLSFRLLLPSIILLFPVLLLLHSYFFMYCSHSCLCIYYDSALYSFHRHLVLSVPLVPLVRFLYRIHLSIKYLPRTRTLLFLSSFTYRPQSLALFPSVSALFFSFLKIMEQRDTCKPDN